MPYLTVSPTGNGHLTAVQKPSNPRRVGHGSYTSSDKRRVLETRTCLASSLVSPVNPTGHPECDAVQWQCFRDAWERGALGLCRLEVCFSMGPQTATL